MSKRYFKLLSFASLLFALGVFGGFQAEAKEVVLFGFTNSWRYNQTTSYDGTNWTAPSFDDSALPSGQGVLAMEDAGNPTVVAVTNTALTIGRRTYYFRTRFDFNDRLEGVSLTFSNIVDDGVVFYLNGVEVRRLYVTNGVPITYSSFCTNHEAAVERFTLSGPIVETNLVQGENVLAVEVHQTSSGSTDIVFGLALSATSTLTPPPLNLPLTLPTYGYTTVNAFPGLSFGSPLCIRSAPGETNRLFVLGKGGQMYTITNLANPTNVTTVMSLAGRVFTGSESGLIGLAFHPGFATNRYFYLFYSVTTNSSQGNGVLHQRVSRFQMTETNANVALQNSELLMFNQRDPAGNHNGGDLHFGPDGYLYISLGDGGVQQDGDRNSQLITSNYFSAVMRIDVDKLPGNLLPNPHPANSTNYFVPADNPFIGLTSFDGRSINPTNIRTEFWAIGFRNPWRLSFDPVNNFLYCGDVGQGTWEEIDVLTQGGNYGWAYLEGNHPGFRATNTVVGPLIPPIAEYHHGGGPDQGDSVTGGVVYRGNRLPDLHGWYVFADYVSGNVWRLFHDGTNTTPFQRITTRANVAGFGIDPSNGDVLLASLGGTIYRLIYDTNTLQGIPIPPTLTGTGAFTNLTSLTNQTQPLAVSTGLHAYDVNVPLWSDNAQKARWLLGGTNLQMTFNSDANWSFPEGMAWVKHFDIELTNGVPS
ncbi:MAG TPA: PQQ-dependent sugar dehydrogenase, partial [Candidatus Acidoferrum sp.]|nr:PQQ-dependent sugar dehydrogenase [Candidatus Acidoferrum sp.]